MKTLEVSVEKLTRTKNSRKITPSSVQNLAESIRAVGLLQPILVRPGQDGQYQIVAGHRRLEACKIAGIKTVTVIVLKVDDDLSAQVVQVTENIHRLDLEPLEEAEAIEKLIKLGQSPEEISALLAKPARYIARRAKLTNLSKKWKQAVKSGRDPDSGKRHILSSWPIASLELVARYPKNRQDKIFEYFEEGYEADVTTYDELKRWLEADEYKLTSAPWKLTEAEVAPGVGACSGCVIRSDAELLLFHDEGDTDKDARCLDRECWMNKMLAFLLSKEGELKEKYPGKRLVHISTGGQPFAPGYEKETVYDEWQHEKCQKADKDAVVGLCVSGPEIGKWYWVKLLGRSQDKAKQKKPGEPLTMEEKRQRLTDRRNKWVWRSLKETVTESEQPEGIKKDSELDKLRQVLTMVMLYGYNSPYIEDRAKTHQKLLAVSVDELITGTWEEIKQRLTRALNAMATGADVTKAIKEIQILCSIMGLDFPKLQKESELAIKRPKAWGQETK